MAIYTYFQNLWNGMYLRWIINQTMDEEADKKICEIIERNKTAKTHVAFLRKQLQDLEAQAKKLGIQITTH